mmetsp:Transcript_29308/g.53636  ORF Transcript_29308/g.53636 Transcript_29308/m.53636 type:complete len:188 (+) Transcript_29308:185-748(+)
MTASSGESKEKKTSMPPSMFRPNGMDDCERPACHDTISAMNSALGRIQEQDKKKATPSLTKTPSLGLLEDVGGCPPDTRTLGTSSWNLLHSMTAWYPNKPTVDDSKKMTQFMEAMAYFYPCTYCAEDFQQNIQQSPPKTESRDELCLWLCDQHNRVNEKLGKPLFKCEMKLLDERWRKSKNPKYQKY